jgi:hypothetical protein
MVLKLFYYANESRFVQFDSIEKGCRNVKFEYPNSKISNKTSMWC